ncbi:MAG TPA: bifunctional 5,10-methylenetetrahydrofolate dehydrogenase/5,10-methenyltetrahydrofolate cyclohydrolase [Candidatus Paceibacterota bacterium]|nr:bifunctional 5,10-methylenetetrahydrofolate dehydrogenase/5,10-methenyltetrahydrofolate cyclohydrolase [Candidatus Paceibacterota bacterium]
MIFDGRALAIEVLARTKAHAGKLPHSPRIVAYVAEDSTPVTRSYLSIKKKSAEAAGCMFERTKDVDSFHDVDAVIVQLPLPFGFDMQGILDSIPVEKDADVLSGAARKNFERGDTDALLPPVVGAICEILKFGHVEIAGKKAVIVGRGFLVGAPVAAWLTQQGADVTVLTSKDDLSEALHAADIVVSGAGVPHLIQPEMIKKGVVLIDAGTSESGGAVVGDADPTCADKCTLFTPVPGGVGPLAVAKLFENVVTLVERAMDI